MNVVTYTALKKLSKVPITREKRTWQTLVEEEITFSDKDADGMPMAHNDALVIILQIFYTDVRHIFVDPSSSANIIQMRVIKEIHIEDMIITKALLLSGFNNFSEMTKGEITLRTFLE